MSDDYRDTDKVLSIIGEVNEVLSLSNQPQNLVDMVLDTLLELLKVDCCWVQLYQSENHRLQLAACRGFTQDMKQEIDSTDFEHSLAHQVVALGYEISISDLSRDGQYGLSSFSKAGLCSVVAVPLMTYRIQGVMGIAFSSKKGFPAGVGKLLMAIGGLVGTALSKVYLYQRELAGEKQLSISAQLEAQSIPNSGERIEADSETEFTVTSADKVKQQSEGIGNVIQGTSQGAAKRTKDTFDEHTHRMKSFRRVHIEDLF
jgi:transcriptional regulator with GAF, ATPase, and Fis domain